MATHIHTHTHILLPAASPFVITLVGGWSQRFKECKCMSLCTLCLGACTWDIISNIPGILCVPPAVSGHKRDSITHRDPVPLTQSPLNLDRDQSLSRKVLLPLSDVKVNYKLDSQFVS